GDLFQRGAVLRGDVVVGGGVVEAALQRELLGFPRGHEVEAAAGGLEQHRELVEGRHARVISAPSWSVRGGSKGVDDVIPTSGRLRAIRLMRTDPAPRTTLQLSAPVGATAEHG